jgi:hypothetical protein
MNYSSILIKMNSLFDTPVRYSLNTDQGPVNMNDFIGQKIELTYTGEIYCIKCGKRTSKSFGQGYCYPCFIKSPETEECVLRPELCQAHLGIARDMEYAKEHCLQDHFVYLASSSEIKVGVTRISQIPTRWIDQGATMAVKIARTSNRYYAGMIEVALKKHLTDKTNWRAMLTNRIEINPDFDKVIKYIHAVLPDDLKKYLLDKMVINKIEYPVVHYPDKVISVDLDKEISIKEVLIGIKGQYLLFENNKVINVRKYSGYKVNIKGNAGNHYLLPALDQP